MQAARLLASRDFGLVRCEREDRSKRPVPPDPRGSCAAGAGAGPAGRISRIQAARSVGLTWPNAGLKRTGQRSVRSMGPHRRSNAQSKSARSQRTNLTSSFGLSRVEVAPEVGLDLARARRLEVEDDVDPGIDRRDVDRAAGLEQDGLPGVGQPGHQRKTSG